MDVRLLEAVKSKITIKVPTIDDDFVDRINHHYTSMIFFIFTAVVAAKSYAFSPLQCFVPAHYKGWWERYAESYCYIQHTYYVPWDEDISGQQQARDEKSIRVTYYQWVPIMLGASAFLFYVPAALWRMLYWKSGLRLDSIMQLAIGGAQNADETAAHIREGIEAERKRNMGCTEKLGEVLSHIFICCFSRSIGNYLVSLYLLIKLLYIANLILQLVLVNLFLGVSFTEYPFFGFNLIVNLIKGREWHFSGQFPRVTYCDFSIRSLGQPPQKHTVQCVMSVNLFNEKIYIFIWFWCVAILILTIINTIMWLYKMLVPSSRWKFIFKYLEMAQKFRKEEKAKANPIDDFVNDYLKRDGVFVLRLIAGNAGYATTSDVVHSLYKSFKQSEVIDDKIRQKQAEMLPSGASSLYSGTFPRTLDPPLYPRKELDDEASKPFVEKPYN